MSAFIAAALLVLSMNSLALAADIVMIINKSNAVSTISYQDIQNIYLGKKTTWESGKRIVPIIQDNPNVHDSFTKQILKKNSQQYATYWKKALFTGAGLPPKAVDGNGEIKALIAGNKDAVGYISADALDSTVKKLELR